jgi:thiol-disulfide isomerase/thioredoxin
MYRILLFLLVGFTAQQAAAQTEIAFEHGTWDQILQKAQQENKIIFLDAYASWCGPCKWMAANVFTNPEAAAFYNAKFINAKIDMEKGEGIALATKYGVSAFPTMLYIDGTGKVVHRTCGSAPAETFIESGTRALDPAKRLDYFTGIYNTGTYGTPFLNRYLNMLSESCSPGVNDIAMKHLATIKDEDLPLTDNWNMINKYVTDINSREFKYLVNNKNKFKSSDAAEVEKKIFTTYVQGANEYLGKPVNEEGYTKYKKQVEASGYARSAEVLLNADLNYYRKKADWKNYFATMETYFKGYDVQDANLLNKAAWDVYEHSTDKTTIKNAIKWIEKSVVIDNASYNNDTYAALLLKAGRKKEALEVEQKALELAKADGEDLAPYEDMIKKIKASK